MSRRLDDSIGPPTSHADLMARLTQGELRVLRELATDGPTNVQIARRLHLSLPTIRSYFLALFRRFEVSSRTELAIMAWRYGLMTEGEA